MTELQTTEQELFGARTIEDHFRVAKLLLDSKMLPAQYNTESKIMVGVQYALELGLKPLNALRQIAVIQGTPSLYGDLPLSLAMNSGLLESIEEYYVDKDMNRIDHDSSAEVFGHTTVVVRKGMKPHYSTFTMADKAKAGLNGPTWNKFPKDMLKYRSRARALKDKFPDVLNGIAIKEYDFDGIDRQEKTRIQKPSQEVTDAFEITTNTRTNDDDTVVQKRESGADSADE